MNTSTTIAPQLPSAGQLATEFAVVLLDTIGADNLRTVVERNASAEYAFPVCASQDFCDANMVMLRACNGFGIEVDAETAMNDEAWSNLWAEAWAIARTESFAAVLNGDY